MYFGHEKYFSIYPVTNHPHELSLSSLWDRQIMYAIGTFLYLGSILTMEFNILQHIVSIL